MTFITSFREGPTVPCIVWPYSFRAVRCQTKCCLTFSLGWHWASRAWQSPSDSAQRQAGDGHITVYEYARVLAYQEDYSDENESHLHCKLKQCLKQSRTCPSNNFCYRKIPVLLPVKIVMRRKVQNMKEPAIHTEHHHHAELLSARPPLSHMADCVIIISKTVLYGTSTCD